MYTVIIGDRGGVWGEVRGETFDAAVSSALEAVGKAGHRRCSFHVSGPECDGEWDGLTEEERERVPGSAEIAAAIEQHA